MKNSCNTTAIDGNKNILAPAFLVEADSYAKGCKKVMYFLEITALVKYDNFQFSPDLSCSASEQKFWKIIDNGLKNNRQSVAALIEELQNNGYRQLAELTEMKQGYESKMLHILVHLLDGFIGIDSSFYSIIEDSHQISDSLRRKIRESPGKYWLLQGNTENSWSFL